MTQHAHLVIVDPGGLYGAYLDEDLAHRMAEAIGGVVVSLPITADYGARDQAVSDHDAEADHG